MSYLDHVRRCNSYSESQYQRFFIGEQCLGLTHNDHVTQLQDWPNVFYANESGLHLRPTLNTPEKRSLAVNDVMQSLHQRGVINSWVDEQYAVNTHFEGDTLMLIERAAVAYLGVRGYGIHVNGLVQKSDGIYLWVAERSRSKPFWPGMLDQMVAGGQPTGISVLENLVKESAEEADIPETVARKATLQGEVHYCMASHRGLNNDGIFIYDLWLDEAFTPRNTDGEVESFQLMPIQDVADLVDQTTRFKDNCNLVNIDLFLRLGLIGSAHPDYQEIKQTLYADPLIFT